VNIINFQTAPIILIHPIHTYIHYIHTVYKYIHMWVTVE